MIILDRIALRLGRRSVRLLGTAILFEIAGSSAIVFFWPAGWALGLVLVTTALLRLYALAERGREAVVGPTVTLYVIVGWLAAISALAAVATLVVAALGALIAGGWV